MENSYQKIQFIAELYGQYSFGCKKWKCRYEIFSRDLNKYLSSAEKTEDEKKNYCLLCKFFRYLLFLLLGKQFSN